jgi:hypothetical protein
VCAVFPASGATTSWIIHPQRRRTVNILSLQQDAAHQDKPAARRSIFKSACGCVFIHNQAMLMWHYPPSRLNKQPRALGSAAAALEHRVYPA